MLAWIISLIYNPCMTVRSATDTLIPRVLAATLREAASQYPVVTVTGPRQSGKTTLCRATFPDHDYVSLEPLDNREFATHDPRGFLGQYPAGVILDEAQRAPTLFSYVQELVDQDPRRGRFIVSGSENLALSQAIIQSLAGRSAMLVLLPLSLEERSLAHDRPSTLDDALFQGGYPRPLAEGIPTSRWLQDYYTTYVQRDVRQLSQIADLATFSRFVRLCAGRTAQEVNLSQLGSDTGVSHNTARAWLGVLEASYLVVQLPAWHRNVRKQLIKSPKLHFLDVGLACSLIGIHEPGHLETHPARGALFETLVATEVLKWHMNRGRQLDMSHYRETRGAEIDIVIPQQPTGTLIECKSGQTVPPDFNRHMTSFSDDSWRKFLVYGGDREQVRNGVTVLPWRSLEKTAWE